MHNICANAPLESAGPLAAGESEAGSKWWGTGKVKEEPRADHEAPGKFRISVTLATMSGRTVEVPLARPSCTMSHFHRRVPEIAKAPSFATHIFFETHELVGSATLHCIGVTAHSVLLLVF